MLGYAMLGKLGKSGKTGKARPLDKLGKQDWDARQTGVKGRSPYTVVLEEEGIKGQRIRKDEG